MSTLWNRIEGLWEDWRVSPVGFRRYAFFTLILLSIIIVTGGAVRLTQSGLGCPTWPNCTGHHLVAALRFHPMIEFVNRLITILCSIMVMGAVVVAYFRRPYRKDLMLLALGLVGGLVLEIVLGGLTVLAKLDPPFVMAHFLLSLLIVWNAFWMYARSARENPRPTRRVTMETIWIGRILLVALSAVIAIGTAVTGSGPHSGSPIAKRLPFPLRDVAQLHADAVLFLIGLTLASLFLLHQGRAAEDIQRIGRYLLIAEAGQAIIGYTQYFSGLPALLVGFHIAGATTLWLIALTLYFSLWYSPSDLLSRENDIGQSNGASGVRQEIPAL